MIIGSILASIRKVFIKSGNINSNSYSHQFVLTRISFASCIPLSIGRKGYPSGLSGQIRVGYMKNLASCCLFPSRFDGVHSSWVPQYPATAEGSSRRPHRCYHHHRHKAYGISLFFLCFPDLFQGQELETSLFSCMMTLIGIHSSPFTVMSI